MKFSLFLHMERYNQDKTHKESLQELVELVQMAEEGGFEAAWIGEHHAMEFTIAPNPLSYLAYLADKTHSIRLGAGTFVAPFWHPIKLASESALVDIMSNGRLDVGIARGAYQCEFDRMVEGMSASDGGKHLREMVPAVQQLWQGDYAHEGEVYSFPTSTSVPKPQQSKVPVWVAARDLDSHNFAVANGCNVMVTPLMKGDEEVADLMNKFEGAVSNNPQVERPRIMLLRHTHVHAADQSSEVGVNGLQNWYLNFFAWAKNDQTPVNGFVAPLGEDAVKEMPFLAKDVLAKNLVIGTPEEVISRLKYYEEIGIDQYSFWIDNSLSIEEKKKSLSLFIREVLPAFQ